MIINAGGGYGSGGGGGGSYSVLTVINKSGSSTKTIAKGSSLVLDFNWSSTVEGIPTGDGTLTIKEGSIIKNVRNIKQGDISVDVTDYLNSEGTTSLTLLFSDVYDTVRPLIFTITVVDLKLTSTFDVDEIKNGPFYFRFTPETVGTKQMVIKIDGVAVPDPPAPITDVGIEHSYYVSTMTHGSHILEAYFTMELNENIVSSNVLKYDVMYVTAEKTPVITSQFFQTTASQYDTILINYKVYTPDKNFSEVILNNGKTIKTVTVDRNNQSWSVSLNEKGEKTLTIKTGAITKTFNISVTEVPGMPEAVTENLELYLTSEGKTNADIENRDKWSWGPYQAQFSNFGWVSDGWQNDSDNVTMLKVSGDGRVYIPFYIFEKNFKTTGETIEIDFSTSNVTNYDSEIITCWNNDRGIKLTPQKMIFQSEQVSNFSTPFKDDEHIRLSLVVQKWTEQRLIFCYINGIMSAAIQYPDSDNFNQLEPVGITIGSNYADTNIYCIRVYDNDLSRFNVLDNWIADTRVGALKRNRFDRNNVIDKSINKITPEKLPDYLPYMILNAEELPKTKPDPKIVSGSYTDRLHPEKSFTFTGASFDVQGTSSKDYSRKNYKAKFKKGFTINGEHQDKYALTDNSIPVSTFCFKADVASSEGANNVELVNYYNQISPNIPPKDEDPRIRHGIEGYPIAMFWNNGVTTTFLGKYNFNNDKSTNEVYGLETGDESWEFLNNVSDMTRWKDDDFSKPWDDNVEARYPDGSTEISNLKEFISWVKSTDSTAATGNPITPVTYEGKTYTTDSSEYRIAKFRAELENWANVDAMIFNYVFTEVFLMVDNRAKNVFPTKYHGDNKWYILPYDYDTALGCDNVGTLSFDYKYEYTDNKVIGDESSGWVYNDESKSVLFTNLRLGFPEEIKKKYADLASATTNKLCYKTVKERFENHQSKWGEAVFNEDAWYKYIQPLIDEGTTLYLPMVQGSKAEQRKWWLYNRFKYMDSKYNAGEAAPDRILLRAYAPSNITVYPFADIYATINWGGTLDQKRAFRGNHYTFNCPFSTLNDTEIDIYSSSQLLSVGDLSGFKPRIADFTFATHISEIKVGDSNPSYSNPNLTDLSVANNRMLKKIDASNCINLTKPVDATGCNSLEEAIFDGTKLTSIDLPKSGMLKKLHLPNTIKSLKVLNQPNITDLVLNESELNLTSLWLENNGDIFNQYSLIMKLATGGSVRVTDFDHTFSSRDEILTFINKLSTLNGLDEQGGTIIGKAQVFGTIRIDTLYDYDYKAIMAAKPEALELEVNTIIRTIKKFEVSGNWTKNQVVGEPVKNDGLIFTATWGDDVIATVPNNDEHMTVSPMIWPRTGSEEVATFTYTINGTSASCEKKANVIKVITSLTVSDAWNNKQFYDNAPDISELVFTAHYNNGSSATVTDISVAPEKWTGIGTQTATFTYSETYTEGISSVSCEKSTTVYRKLISLTCDSEWTKPQFYNTAPDISELMFTASYNYGEAATVTPTIIEPTIWTEVGPDKIATFTYTENGISESCTKSTTVYRKLESIYYAGTWGYQYYNDSVNINGITFKAHYNYGEDSEIIPVITPTTWTGIGTQTATFTYIENGISKSFDKEFTVVAKMIDFAVSDDWVKPQFYNTAPDISELVFTASYNYGEAKTVRPTTVEPVAWTGIGTQTATFTYIENGITKTISKEANVVKKLDSLTYSGTWGYQYYNDSVNTDGITFTIHYNNGDSQNIDRSLVIVTPATWTSIGTENWAEFSYTDEYGIRVAVSKSFEVVAKLEEALTVENDWENEQYVESPVDPTGLKFTAYYNNGTSKVITHDLITSIPEVWGPEVGTQTATFIYTENGIIASVAKSAEVSDIPVYSLVHRTIAGISDTELTKIGEYALAECISLKTVTVPAVTEIGDYAFLNCSNLVSIKLGVASCSLGNGAFSGSGITSSSGTIYVPNAYVDSYKSAPSWSEYSSRIVGY